MRITGDSAEGKAELDRFIDPEEPYPVIATTSQLMTTGVDAKTCKLVVLDRTIKSMTMFKQIIGRGTRIDEEHNKLFFTIMDFKKATELFRDPDFDGDPVVIWEPESDDPITPPEPVDDDETDIRLLASIRTKHDFRREDVKLGARPRQRAGVEHDPGMKYEPAREFPVPQEEVLLA